VRTRATDSAICSYTCGTTGAPKAILHCHAYTCCLRYTASHWLDVRPGELHWTTFETDEAEAAYGSLFGPWMNGAAIFMYGGPIDPRRELELLARYPIATLCASPTEYLIMLERYSGGGLRALRHCTSAGEKLDGETFDDWNDRFGLKIHEGYGQTETAIAIANLPGMGIKTGSMGRAFPGYDVRVLDAEGREASDGETGEIAIRVSPERPPPLFLHYWKDAEMTAAALHGDYYFTGDRASRDADGYFWFASRSDAPAKA
jgi:medium-chain acyl-CoA synthetase